MKRAIWWIIIFTSFTLTSSAQEMSGRFSVGISAGAAVPVGKFASMDTTSARGTSGSAAGWAKVGEAINVSVYYHFSSVAAIAFQVGGQRNSRDAAPRRKQLVAANQNVNLRPEVKERSWDIGKLMFGGIYDLPISTADKIHFQFSMFAGVCKTAIPSEESILYTENPVPGEIGGGKSGTVPLPLAFCYQGSLGIKYLLTPRVSTVGEVNYFGANSDDNYHYAATIQDFQHPVAVKKTYRFNTVSPMVGMEYTFR